MNGRANAEAIAARIAEAGVSVVIPDEPLDGVWRLTLCGRSSWKGTLDVPADPDGPAGAGMRLHITWPDSEKADPRHAARLHAFADLARSWGWDVVDRSDDEGRSE
ncbi:hypothetical protein [Nonomuraea sp. NPDC049141]|uniref:hypothetical protein n=1 Tax=Nonomuraea sp. NPDC049141 TaxID=3155500 RepID=UPI0033DFAEF4